MKKILGLIIFIILIICAMNINFGNRVFNVETPSKIFIDLNNNFIFDEKDPVIISNLYYINQNTDFNKYPVLKSLTDDEKFFLEYKAKETSDNLLKNRFVKVKDGDIQINNQSYYKLMLNSKFAFNDDIITQKELTDNVKSLNLDDYVILNLKNRKYHKLNCNLGRKSAKYKIVKLSDIKNTADACKTCHIQAKKQVFASNKKTTGIINKKENFFGENIKIFFLDLNKTFKPDNSCRENACKTLKEEINNAKETIDFAVYGINNQPQILNALIKAHNRGVKIRRVYDYSEKKYYEDNDKLDEIIKTFKTDENYDKTKDAALMHNKYFIFDNKKVWTGSSNISSTDLSGFNSNYTILLDSKQTAQKYKEDFEQMYNGVFHKSKNKSNPEFIQINPETRIKPMFSPQDNIIFSEIIPLIKSAKKYIYMPAFFITYKSMEEALTEAHLKGVEVKIISDATNAHTKYTIHKNLRKAGIKVKTENYAGKMHSKTIIVDDKYTIIGSMNFTRSGNSKNDENMLLIENSEIAKFMRSTFMYLWKKIPEKYETYDPKAESTESIGSCFDGIDNDFDDKTDMEDEGCFYKKK